MIELTHKTQAPQLLQDYLKNNPTPAVNDFDSYEFSQAKKAIKTQLNIDQGGLCVYCERPLSPSDGQVEHIKPKGGINAHPSLCFTYTNYAHSCIDRLSCGQKKKDGVLPIEPAIGCNDKFTLDTTTGHIISRDGLTRQERHAVKVTNDMLGLNRHSALVQDRKMWIISALKVLQDPILDFDAFLKTSPYRSILKTL